MPSYDKIMKKEMIDIYSNIALNILEKGFSKFDIEEINSYESALKELKMLGEN